mgnify:CR=1 FL=1
MIYIYGAGGHSKVVYYTFSSCEQEVVAFVDDNPHSCLCDLPVLSPEEIPDYPSCVIHFAIGKNSIRYRLQKEWQQRGFFAKTAIHIGATIYPDVSVGAGSLVAVGSIVGPDTVIGDGCIVNHNAVIDHDNSVGEFCHIAPSATLGGGVTVGAQCLIGAGATILPNLTVGDFVTVGAGAVVTQDVRDGVVVVGCPARPINHKKRCDEH